ncbi:hypothetical protein CDL15_Pgr028784 [Punica granatum]|uniref:Uncharacterized protein n=1 Tax=Punica granatum TaxID=22663 RepID=A0A218VXC2_PUNGR|nr:hypothetical protein CDL15_Pgr028784 [Punica granatum]
MNVRYLIPCTQLSIEFKFSVFITKYIVDVLGLGVGRVWNKVRLEESDIALVV